MKARTSLLTTALITVLTAVLISATGACAATFPLAWDSNCNADPTLIGYNIYYSAGSPVTADPDSADIQCISLDDPDFDPDHPTAELTGLKDNVVYYFTVTAVYNDGESEMSNEISGKKSSTVTTSKTDTTSTTTTPVTNSTPVKDTTSITTTSVSDPTNTTDAISPTDPTDPAAEANTPSVPAFTPSETNAPTDTDTPQESGATPGSNLATPNTGSASGGSGGGGCFIDALN